MTQTVQNGVRCVVSLSLQTYYVTLLYTTSSVTFFLISHPLITLSFDSFMLVTASNKPLPYITTLVCEWLSQTWVAVFTINATLSSINVYYGLCFVFDSRLFLFGLHGYMFPWSSAWLLWRTELWFVHPTVQHLN